MLTDTELLKKAQSNDQKYLDIFMQKYSNTISKYAMMICKKPDIAEDIAQISRIRIAKAIPNFRNDCSVTIALFLTHIRIF